MYSLYLYGIFSNNAKNDLRLVLMWTVTNGIVWNSFVNWLTQHLPPKPKVIDEAFEHVKNTILKLFPRNKDAFDVEETKSALGEFVKEYVITGCAVAPALC